MTPATTHPLVAAWLRDLELMLHGVEPGERAEVLAGVHEHLDASLPPGASDDDVRRVLADLGSPESVADEAYAGRPPTPGTARGSSHWQGLVAVTLNGICVAFLMLVVSLGTAHAAEVLFVFVGLFLLPWVAICVLSAVAPMWTAREKVTSALLLPGTAVALSATLWVLLLTVGPHIVNLLPTLAVLGAAAWVLVRLGRSALR